MKLHLLLIASALVAAPALAQAPLGTVTNVQGVVTATQGGTAMTVTPGTAIRNGMRFVTTSSASVTLQLSNGCTVNVPPAHGVTVLQSMTCQQLVAAVQPVVPVAGGAPVPPPPALIAGAIGLGVVGILAGAASGGGESQQPLSAQ